MSGEPIHSTTAAYMLASQPHGTLYVGVSGEFLQRIGQHRAGDRDGFTRRYEVNRLVWFEMFDGIVDAIAREKQIKRYPRQWKINLIERVNPHWEDLWSGLVAETANPQFDPFDPRFTSTRQADFDWRPLLARHPRACPGDPFRGSLGGRRDPSPRWIPGTRPGMTI